MLKGKFVKVRFRRSFADQKLWVLIGKVLEFTENWVAVEGIGLVVFKGRPDPVDMDEEPRTVVIPRDNIAHIRVLPDSFDLTNIRVKSKHLRIYAAVDHGPDTSISE